MKDYRITNQKALRAEFWETFPELSRKKNKEGQYCTDTRCAFIDWLDMMARDGAISEKLAQRATL